MKTSKSVKLIAIITGILTVAISGIMNIVLMPQIEANTGGIKCFDMNFGYTAGEAKEFLNLIGENGRHIYLDYQLPLDFIYPVIYTAFFIVLKYLFKKLKTPFMVLPVILAAVDYAENIFSEIMLRADEFLPSVAKTASIITVIKTLLMYLIFLILIVLLIKMIVTKQTSGNR